MSDRLLIKQLRAIRDLVDNALELAGDVGDELPAGPCLHPKEKRRAAGVMGDPDRFYCGECGELVIGTAGEPVSTAATPTATGS